MTAHPLFRLDGARLNGLEGRYRLDIPELEIPSGGVVAIVGRSGSGKSSLIELLGGLTLPDAGSVTMTLPGDAPLSWGVGTGDSYPSGSVGRIFQQGHLLANAAVSTNLAAAVQEGRTVDRQAIVRALTDAGLTSDKIDRRAFSLSGGEQQRVAAARSLIGNRPVLLADEPTSSLDPDLGRALMETLKTWCNEPGTDRTILWVTHDYDLAEEIADSLLVLDRGGIAGGARLPEAVGDAAQIRARVERTQRAKAAGNDAESTASFDTETGNVSSLIPERLALAEICSRDAGDTSGESTDALSRLVSFGRKGSVFAAVPAFFRGYSEWGGQFLQQLLAALLLMGATMAIMVQQRYAEASISDPSVCHTVVGGRLASRDFGLDPARVMAWGSQFWNDGLTTPPAPTDPEVIANPRLAMTQSLAAHDPEQGCAVTQAAWPRHNLTIGVGRVHPKDGCRNYGDNPGQSGQIDILFAHPNEPLLGATLTIPHLPKAGSNPPAGGISLHDALSTTSNTPPVVLSRDFVERYLVPPSAPGQDADAPRAFSDRTVCIKRPRFDAVEARLTGISDRLYRDRQHFYDGVMPLHFAERQSHRELRYKAMAIYFEPKEIEPLRAALNDDSASREERFNFDPDTLDRVADVIKASVILSWILIATVAMVAILIFSVTISAFASRIAINAQPLAMLRTLGTRDRFLSRYIATQLHLVWIVVLPVVAVIYAVYLFGLAPLLASWSEIPAVILTGQGWQVWYPLFAVLALWLLSRLAVHLSLSGWLRANDSRLGSVLQSGR